jgi:hypothetical protein
VRKIERATKLTAIASSLNFYNAISDRRSLGLKLFRIGTLCLIFLLLTTTLSSFFLSSSLSSTTYAQGSDRTPSAITEPQPITKQATSPNGTDSDVDDRPTDSATPGRESSVPPGDFNRSPGGGGSGGDGSSGGGTIAPDVALPPPQSIAPTSILPVAASGLAAVTGGYMLYKLKHRLSKSKTSSILLGRSEKNLETDNEAYPSEYDSINDRTAEQITERYPSAIFPSKVALGDIKPLKVVIKSAKPESVVLPSISQASEKMELTTSKDERDVPVLVVVDPENPHFEVQGDYYKTINVPTAKEDSNPVIFDLKAKKEGSAEIKLQFFQQRNYLGQVTLLIDVVVTKLQADIIAPSESITHEFELVANIVHDSSDVTLIILQTESQPTGRYDIIFTSEKYGVIPAGSISLEYDPESKFHQIFEDIENTNLSPNEIEDRIRDKGLNLYDELVPPALKELYWKIRDDVKSIQVYSKEPWIPWEIIKPWRKLSNGEPEEDEFLCERFIVSRWLIGMKKKKKTNITKAKLVVPADSKLRNALAERDWLIEFLGNRGIDVSVDSSYEEVKHTLKTERYDLIHFSSHGKHVNDMPIHSVIELENGGEIRPDSIVGIATRFGTSHPLVFLNSCQSGRQAFSLVGIQSWVKKFLDSGASCFIGTLWSVSDETALKFTQELYSELSKGIAVGEAVRTARKNCKKFGDPSWLAYEFYGQPNIKIAFNDKGGKVNVV